MLYLAARLMTRMGTTLLVLALLLRLLPMSPSGAVGDDLAIVASLLVTITAAAYARFGR